MLFGERSLRRFIGALCSKLSKDLLQICGGHHGWPKTATGCCPVLNSVIVRAAPWGLPPPLAGAPNLVFFPIVSAKI